MAFRSFTFTRLKTALAVMLAIPAFAVATPASAQENIGAQTAAALPDRGEFMLALFSAGERDGFMRLGWIKTEEGVQLYDRSMLTSSELYEVMALSLTPDLQLDTASVQLHRGTAYMDLDLQVADGRASGSRVIHRLEGTESRSVDLEVPAGTLPRAAAFLMPLVMPETDGAQNAFHWYGALGNAFADVTITARLGGMIVTPAGSFDTTRYEIRGGAPENDVYVTHGEDRRVVRIDVIGSELQFLALPEPEAAE